MRLNPFDAHIMALRAPLSIYLGKPDEGERWARRAMQLNLQHPDWYVTNLGLALCSQGRYDEAIVAYAKVAAPQVGILTRTRCELRPVWQRGRGRGDKEAPARAHTKVLGTTIRQFQAIPPRARPMRLGRGAWRRPGCHPSCS